VDNRSDIFSFGVLVFELMSGQSPFPGSSINTILYRIVNEPPVEVQPPVMGVLPEGWRRVFDKVLAKRPEDRHPSCTAFVRDLLDAVVELGKEDRREVLGLLRMSGEAPLPEIVSTSFDETMVVARPEPRKSGWPWMVALVLAVLVAGGWFLFKGPKGTRLRIESLPANAKVFVNDLEVGSTPTNQPLLPGDKVRLELKGHQPFTYEFKQGEAPTAFKLDPIIKDEVLDSVPPGATVVLDQKQLEGATPLTVRWNQGTRHELTITKGKLGSSMDFAPGEAPNGRAFELKEATTADTRVEPSLDPNAPGFLKLAGGFSVRIKADGKDLGEFNPGSKVPLTPGRHKLELVSADYFYKDAREVVITAGQGSDLRVPGLATLTVDTHPGSGKVFVDGQETRIESDGSSLQVAVGRHVITVRGAKGIKHQTVDLAGDKVLQFEL
jgi:hypothetical protein